MTNLTSGSVPETAIASRSDSVTDITPDSAVIPRQVRRRTSHRVRWRTSHRVRWRLIPPGSVSRTSHRVGGGHRSRANGARSGAGAPARSTLTDTSTRATSALRVTTTRAPAGATAERRPGRAPAPHRVRRPEPAARAASTHSSCASTAATAHNPAASTTMRAGSTAAVSTVTDPLDRRREAVGATRIIRPRSVPG